MKWQSILVLVMTALSITKILFGDMYNHSRDFTIEGTDSENSGIQIGRISAYEAEKKIRGQARNRLGPAHYPYFLQV